MEARTKEELSVNKSIAVATSTVRWAVAITTSPRPQSYVQETLRYLHAAGWDDVCVVDDNGLTGPWRNFLAALEECIKQRPTRVLVLQDDVQLAVNTRQVLESAWPEDADLLSLYCGKSVHDEVAPSSFGWYAVPQWDSCYGALGYAMTRRAALQILEAGQQLRVRPRARQTDLKVAKAASQRQLHHLICHPSLIRHIGDHSTLPGLRMTETRQCAVFAEDARKLMP